jgi:hypothetical protein
MCVPEEERAKINLAYGNGRAIQYMVRHVLASGWHSRVSPAVNGTTPFGKLSEFFKEDAELRAL